MIRRFLLFVCLAVLGVILTLGLWPFRAPSNDVHWLADRPGLVFGRNSSAMTSDSLKATAARRDMGATVEMWLKPARIWDRSTFLAMWNSETRFRLFFCQSQLDLRIVTPNHKYLVDRVFQRNKPALLAVTAGAHGTTIFVDGKAVRRVASLRLSATDLTGRIVVGDSPGQPDSWQGQLYGLAVYHWELTPSEIARNYAAWIQTGRPETSRGYRTAALYLFCERSGTVVQSAVPGPSLLIPARYTVADKTFLNPLWQEFSFSWSYWSAVLKNIVGFVPLGFCFYAWFTVLRVPRTMVATVAVGAAVSVTIEVLQAWLPTRDSGTSDIFTNTLGTWIGAAVYATMGPALAKAWHLGPVAGGHDLHN